MDFYNSSSESCYLLCRFIWITCTWGSEETIAGRRVCIPSTLFLHNLTSFLYGSALSHHKALHFKYVEHSLRMYHKYARSQLPLLDIGWILVTGTYPMGGKANLYDSCFS